MRYCLAICAALILCSCSFNAKKTMQIIPLAISVECKDAPGCVYLGSELNLTIKIGNPNPETIALPIEFLQRRGPAILLVDAVSKAEFRVRPNLADHALRAKLVNIPPGGSASIDWVIVEEEIEHFRKQKIDLTAKISVFYSDLDLPASKGLDYRGEAELRITGKGVKR